MLEDLFNVVKTRFNGNVQEEQKQETEKPVEIPSDMLFKCPRCMGVSMTDEFEKNLSVCPRCNYHARISAPQRLG